MTKHAYVYILTNRPGGTLYTGVTSDLQRRIYEHKHHLFDGFSKRYDLTRLVWFTSGESITGAIELEKKIKNRGRQWKIDLIERDNPGWEDLSARWLDSAVPTKPPVILREEPPVILREVAESTQTCPVLDSATPLRSAQNDEERKGAQNDESSIDPTAPVILRPTQPVILREEPPVILREVAESTYPVPPVILREAAESTLTGPILDSATPLRSAQNDGVGKKNDEGGLITTDHELVLAAHDSLVVDDD